MSGNGALLIPVVFLCLLAWLVPKLLSLVMPEGVKPLMVLAFLSTLAMFVLSSLVFVFLYASHGIGLADLFAPGILPTFVHFGQLGLSAALIWAPIMILSVASLPRHWVKATW